MAASKSNKKRKFIVDKKPNNSPYHLKKRNSNLMDKRGTKIVIILMILAFVVGPIIGIFVYF
jgi:hypothetical protein